MAKSRVSGGIYCKLKTGGVTIHYSGNENPFFCGRNDIVIIHYSCDDLLSTTLDDLEELDPNELYGIDERQRPAECFTDFYPIFSPEKVRYSLGKEEDHIKQNNRKNSSPQFSSLFQNNSGKSSSLFPKVTIHPRKNASPGPSPGTETKCQPNLFPTSIPTPKNIPPISPFSKGSPTKGDQLNFPLKKRW